MGICSSNRYIDTKGISTPGIYKINYDKNNGWGILSLCNECSSGEGEGADSKPKLLSQYVMILKNDIEAINIDGIRFYDINDNEIIPISCDVSHKQNYEEKWDCDLEGGPFHSSWDTPFFVKWFLPIDSVLQRIVLKNRSGCCSERIIGKIISFHQDFEGIGDEEIWSTTILEDLGLGHEYIFDITETYKYHYRLNIFIFFLYLLYLLCCIAFLYYLYLIFSHVK